MPGLTEFWAHSSGTLGQEILDTNPLSALMQQHAIDSSESPFVGITTNPAVAEYFGEVYSVTLPPGMAFPNTQNQNTLNGTNISENEWLVPLHIPSYYVNNPNCTCR